MIYPDAGCRLLAVNRHQAIDAVRQLSEMGAGGVVCFASGFKETGDEEGAALQDALIQAAGSMPVLGPNCYGFVNGLDQTPIWPESTAWSLLIAVSRLFRKARILPLT